jgi:hydroxymethylpyrimidine pyrophosphatase-like HAD family hydrolase
VDFDRTLTGPDSVIPQRNFEAIEYFMENGGAFTVNTGRSTATFWQYLDTIPVNAPFLLYNGSAAYEKGKLTQLRPIDLDPWEPWRKYRNDSEI